MFRSIKNFVIWWHRPNKSKLVDWVQSLLLIFSIAFIIRTWGYGLYQVSSGSMETTMLVGEGYFVDKFSYIFTDPKRGDIISFDDPTYHYSNNKIINLLEHYLGSVFSGPQNWTKRAIGIPGDHVQGKIENGKTVVYVNGQKLDEQYINKYPLIPTGLVWRSYDKSFDYYHQPFYRLFAHDVEAAQAMWQQYGVSGLQEPNTPQDPVFRGSDVYDVQLGDGEYWVMGDNRLGSYDSRGWGKLKREFIHGKIIFRIFSFDILGSSIIYDLLTHPIDFWSRVRWSRFFTIMR